MEEGKSGSISNLLNIQEQDVYMYTLIDLHSKKNWCEFLSRSPRSDESVLFEGMHLHIEENEGDVPLTQCSL